MSWIMENYLVLLTYHEFEYSLNFLKIKQNCGYRFHDKNVW